MWWLAATSDGQVPPADQVGQGWIGFVTFAFLFIATFFLFKSLNKQIKRVDFDEETVDSGNR